MRGSREVDIFPKYFSQIQFSFIYASHTIASNTLPRKKVNIFANQFAIEQYYIHLISQTEHVCQLDADAKQRITFFTYSKWTCMCCLLIFRAQLSLFSFFPSENLSISTLSAVTTNMFRTNLFMHSVRLLQFTCTTHHSTSSGYSNSIWLRVVVSLAVSVWFIAFRHLETRRKSKRIKC